jgi:ubiquinone/menaquinone biosynthesis C-methylase UbiE
MERGKTLMATWNRRVGSWHDHVASSAGFGQVRDAVIQLASPRPDDVCVDLGAGTGFLAFALAPLVASVLAVDVSPAMVENLAEQAHAGGHGNIDARVADLATFDLQPASTDLIVSNYALHHLVDRDKRDLVRRARRWLRPSGRLVVADMMFGRGGTPRDRAILVQKARSMAAKGPAGVWRVGKNLARFGLGVGQERPASPQAWTAMLADAGFAGVMFYPLVTEAGIITGAVTGDEPTGGVASEPAGDSSGQRRRGAA